MNEPQEQLTPQGAARREAMLAELTGAMSRLRRRRRNVRLTSGAAVTVLLGFALFRLAQPPVMDARIVTVPPHRASPTQVEWVSTDAMIAERWRAEPPGLIVQIDDAQLLRSLVEIGRPAGLIRVGQRVALSAPVTDDELAGATR